MTANMCGENISNFDQKNIKMCPDGWIEFFSHNKMGYPDMGNLWKYGIMLKAHNCMFMKEEMTATANSWREIIENLYFEIDNVYALSMSLLHVDDGDSDENDCMLVMVYIFSQCLKVLFYRAPPCYIYSRKTSKVNHEIGPTRNWFPRREFKLIRRVFLEKVGFFFVRTTHFCETKQSWKKLLMFIIRK